MTGKKDNSGKRIYVQFDATTVETLNKRRGRKSMPECIRQDLDSYHLIVKRGLLQLAKKLTRKDVQFLLEAFDDKSGLDSVMSSWSSIGFDHLFNHVLSVTPEPIEQRVLHLSDLEQIALIDLIEIAHRQMKSGKKSLSDVLRWFSNELPSEGERGLQS
jgi:hypothetical protein